MSLSLHPMSNPQSAYIEQPTSKRLINAPINGPLYFTLHNAIYRALLMHNPVAILCITTKCYRFADHFDAQTWQNDKIDSSNCRSCMDNADTQYMQLMSSAFVHDNRCRDSIHHGISAAKRAAFSI
jgi:hypothetical protein